MNLSTDMLFWLLSETYGVERYGRGTRRKELSLPTFWRRGCDVVAGSIYIAHTSDLPNRPPSDCVFICTGSKPPKVWNMWECEVIYVMDAGVDLFDIFNTAQHALDRLITWETHMHQLQTSGAHVRELVEESIPILENRITVCDFELNILATCEYDESRPEGSVRLSTSIERVPAYDIPSMMGFRSSAIRNREPYFFDAPEGKETYCINLFLGDTYIGSCSLQEAVRPLTPLDFELFKVFAAFARDALAAQTKEPGSQVVVAQTVFEQLLGGLPVSQNDMTHAIRLIELNLGGQGVSGYKWCCVVIQNTHRGRTLPESYLCETVASILPNATAFTFDGAIVAFCLIRGSGHRVDEICEPLEAYLADMGFKAGISRTFIDPFHARDYYSQALCAIETGFERDPDLSWYLFGDYALDYMVASSCGRFDTALLVPPELVHLYRSNLADVDYVETLRTFLDNDCRITQTAKDMYLHRTTLIKRLDKIKRYVNIDSADRRLYLRLCLHLPDIGQALANSTDVV